MLGAATMEYPLAGLERSENSMVVALVILRPGPNEWLDAEHRNRFHRPRGEGIGLVDVVDFDDPLLDDRPLDRGQRTVPTGAAVEEPHPGRQLTGALGIHLAKHGQDLLKGGTTGGVNGVDVSTASAAATAATSAADRFSGGRVCCRSRA